MMMEVFRGVEMGLELRTRTKMAALNGGSTGFRARWAVMERAPALWPQLCDAYDVSDETTRMMV